MSARPGGTPDVVVVGAGIVGACAALELARGGASVEVIERGGGWGEGCSWGNAGLLVPSHARPIAAPESLKAGIGWMVRPDSPFGLKLKPSLAPWLARYLRASTARRAHDGEALQRELCRESLGAFRELAAEGIEGGFDQPGCLTVHTSADAEAHAAAEAASETGRTLGARVLTGAEARELEPALTGRVRAAALFPGEGRCDPVRLSAAVGAVAEARGVRLRTGVEAYGVRAGLRGLRGRPGRRRDDARAAARRRGRRGRGRLVWPARPHRRRAAPAPGRQGLRGGVGPGGRAGADAALSPRPARGRQPAGGGGARAARGARAHAGARAARRSRRA